MKTNIKALVQWVIAGIFLSVAVFAAVINLV